MAKFPLSHYTHQTDGIVAVGADNCPMDGLYLVRLANTLNAEKEYLERQLADTREQLKEAIEQQNDQHKPALTMKEWCVDDNSPCQ